MQAHQTHAASTGRGDASRGLTASVASAFVIGDLRTPDREAPERPGASSPLDSRLRLAGLEYSVGPAPWRARHQTLASREVRFVPCLKAFYGPL